MKPSTSRPRGPCTSTLAPPALTGPRMIWRDVKSAIDSPPWQDARNQALRAVRCVSAKRGVETPQLPPRDHTKLEWRCTLWFQFSSFFPELPPCDISHTHMVRGHYGKGKTEESRTMGLGAPSPRITGEVDCRARAWPIISADFLRGTRRAGTAR